MSGATKPMRVVVMGVAGAGKTSVGSALAARLGAPFIDGDDLHPKRNVNLMAHGHPLTDDDRDVWLHRVGDVLADADDTIVVACSALARRYRDIIRGIAPDTRFVHLQGTRALLAGRLSKRRGHFMQASMLDSQLAVLEPLADDEAGTTIDAALDREQIVKRAVDYLTG
jgi:carbohydrate kinase (thermoresistant glucokinase family)